VRVSTAAITTELALPPVVRYLATWRFLASVEVKNKKTSSSMPPGLVWEHIRRRTAPEPPFLYVPAFTLTRITVQQLGLALVQAQPLLELTPGMPAEAPLPPRLVDASGPRLPDDQGPGFGTLSPILLTEEDARAVADFVYLALEAQHSPDMTSIDYQLGLTGAELVFLPAVYDRRHVRDSNWRFLLQEFDGMVA
jgi:hypothetical protein